VKQSLTVAHKKRLAEIKASLTLLGSTEGSFTRTEILFFEVLNIAHQYGDEASGNYLLASLKDLEAKEYKATAGLFAKAAQREKVIRQFMYALKAIITKAGKDVYVQGPAVTG
jgi:hypothetical protein